MKTIKTFKLHSEEFVFKSLRYVLYVIISLHKSLFISLLHAEHLGVVSYFIVLEIIVDPWPNA